jgi:hypothetical protein
LFFERDDVGFGSEEARHLGGEFGIECLVDGREHTAAKQAGDEICADAEFLARSFTLMPSVMVMLRVMGCGSLETTMRGGGV